MLSLAAYGEPEGSWIRAETQTAGRGRMGRGWHSPLGNLYASTIVQLREGDPPPATLALVAAIALREVTLAYAPDCAVSIKWPNDLLIDGAKIAGMLLERTGNAVIIGIGANLGFHPVGLGRPVTSLAAQGVDAPDPHYFCEDLASAFAHWLAIWRFPGLGAIRKAWLEGAHPRNTALTANLGDGTSVDGLFDGLEDDGALRLRLADGSLRVIHAADVFLL